MQSLWNEVQNLKATAKSWEIVTLRNNNYRDPYPFDSKYSTWNFMVLSASGISSGGSERFSRSYNSANFTSKDGRDGSISWTKSGNSIVQNGINAGGGTSITVLFYK